MENECPECKLLKEKGAKGWGCRWEGEIYTTKCPYCGKLNHEI